MSSDFLKNNRTKIAFILIFVGISAYYLFPTFALYLQQNYISGLPPAQQQRYKTNHKQKMINLRKNAISLGLDLQGGMHVTLQLDTPQLVKELAGERKDSSLVDLIHFAKDKALEVNGDFINIFVREFNQRHPNGRLSRYFRKESENITRRSSNAEIKAFLKEQRKKAVGRALQIIRNRINRFGVTQPSIERLGSSRISVALPGVAEKERVRHLLKGTARLEFRLGANPNQLAASRKRIIQYYNTHPAPWANKPDSLASAKSELNTSEKGLNLNTSDSLEQTQFSSNPLLKLMNFYSNTRSRRIVFGLVAANDTAQVNTLLHQPKVQSLLPRNVTLMWGAHPVRKKNGIGIFELIGVKEHIALSGKVITSAQVRFKNQTGIPKVSMSMNSEGARKWARITGANIGKPIAIILDGYVYSYPTVQSKISNGQSSITGMGGIEEAKDLVNILLSGALPAPLIIVQQHTVGPTLGAASIRAGLTSVIVAFVVIVIFMIVYYLRMGAVADVALFFCVLFILGILASFQATLTLPGIAGIVLTIGMAVDANVLINDRIRRDLKSGMSFHSAIDSGYNHALSAIVDGHVTTFLVGVILFAFGSGTIKGFAVTLMAGVVASLFSAVVITRVIVNFMLRDKTKTFNLG